MKDFVIDMADKSTSRRDRIVFSERDLLEVRREAGPNPVTPLIVQEMERIAGEKGYLIESSRRKLFGIAGAILVGRGRLFSIEVQRVKAAEPPMAAESVRDEAARLSMVFYDDPVEDLDKLLESIRDHDRIPIVWSHARGFLCDGLSTKYPLFSDSQMRRLSDPGEALKFIIRKPQARVSYVFEDLHHCIGAEGAVHPAIGEIRSLLKDLYRTLAGRDERIYLFVPASYRLPLELQPFVAGSAGSKKRSAGQLERFGRLLTDESYLCRTKPVVGMKGVIERAIQILAQMEVSNPLLVGHPGVGKTAAADGVAAALLRGQVPSPLKGRALYSLSLNSLVAGTRYRGDFEERIEGLMEEVRQKNGRVIIFIDEIHTLLDAGAAEGAMGAGEILKASLARGEFPCLGATTFAGAEHLARDPALSRRFRKIVVHEPRPEDAIRILKGVAPCFEKHHGLKIEDAALRSAVELSVQHLSDEYLPGKAIALVDASAAYCRMKGQDVVRELDVRMELKRLQNR